MTVRTKICHRTPELFKQNSQVPLNYFDLRTSSGAPWFVPWYHRRSETPGISRGRRKKSTYITLLITFLHVVFFILTVKYFFYFHLYCEIFIRICFSQVLRVSSLRWSRSIYFVSLISYRYSLNWNYPEWTFVHII